MVGFIGPHQVRYAVARGHRVTLFNRGRTNPGLFTGLPGIEERIIDARNLSEWVIRCWEQRIFGVFNATGPASRLTVGEMLEGTRAALGGGARFTHVTSRLLAEQKVSPWSDLPVWIPPEGDMAGMTQRSIARALAKGLTVRPFADTVTATMAFYQPQTEERTAQLPARGRRARRLEGRER